jgi:hypothetical protein
MSILSRTFVCVVALFSGSATGAPEAAAPLMLPGGQADVTPTGEYYRGVPTAAAPRPGTACMVAKRYLDLVNAGRYGEIADLFAADGVVLDPMRGPSGGVARGTAQIDAFYSNRIGRMRPHVIGVAYVGTRQECMLENAARVPPATRYALSSVNHFAVNRQGKITRMVAFARPRGD